MNFEQLLGLKISSMIAGVMGGIVSLTFEEKLSFLRALLLIITGGSTAGYGFKFIEHYFGTQEYFSGIFGFCLGLVSMRLIGAIMKIADKVKTDPSLLFSLPKLIQAVKDGSNRINTTDRPVNGGSDDNVDSIHDAGSGGQTNSTESTKVDS